jgi:hypothetical protein
MSAKAANNRKASPLNRYLLWTCVCTALWLVLSTAGRAGSYLQLAPNLSFTDDSSPNFPIIDPDSADASISTDRPTVIFFGTSHCWNTAREAERLVKVFPKYRDQVRFIVVDLNHASSAQKALADRYYHGYIPTLAIFDARGQPVYDRAGETSATRGDVTVLDELIGSEVKAPAR